VEFRILGPLEVVEDGSSVALGTLKERLILGVLLLHANEFVSRERLIDELWGEAPPPTARKAVNVYVSQLRKALGAAGADPIATASGGYRLQVELDALDASRVQLLLAGARGDAARGELERAAEQFQEALSLWRGPTLAGLQLESRGRDEVAQLDELRLAALMDRIDCDLALGRHDQALGELKVLVREHPLRERLRAQQMLALYRADRQAEALDAYAEARRTLVDDLGIEPSEALQRLQQAILRHDPALERPEGTAAVNGLAPTVAARPTPETDAEPGEGLTRRRFRPRRWHLALAGVALVAAFATPAAILSESAGATLRVTPNSLVELNPRTGKPVLVVPNVGDLPGPIAITSTAIWTANYGDDTVSRYDLRTHKVDKRTLTPGQPNDIVFDPEGNAWITNTPADDQPVPKSVVIRLNAGIDGTASDQVNPSQLGQIHFPLPMAGLEAVGGGHVWVIVGFHGPLPGDNRVAVVNSLTERVSVLRLDESATAVAYGYDSAWIGTYGLNGPSYKDDSELEVFRAGQSKPEKVVLDKHGARWGPVSIAVGDGAVWVVTYHDSGNQLLKINPITLRVAHRLDLSRLNPGSVAVGAGGVWTINDHAVTKIDPHTMKIIRTFPLTSGKVGQLCGIAATRRELWVSSGHVYCDTIGS
jgi:DNA-binding SARP family transcriptional activator/streptogramin lyase